MDIRHEEHLREEFEKILIELSRDQAFFNDPKKRSDCFVKLEELYFDNKFRHYYSDVFSVLNRLHCGEIDGDINILGQNLDWIRRGYQPKNPDPESPDGAYKDISKKINKLYDHVNLDISRILASDASSWRLMQEDELRQLNKKIDESGTKLQEVNTKIKDSETKLSVVENKLESAQKEYISILGLFATIVLAFIGSIVFSTSVLENMHKSSVYRVTLIVLLIAFTLINVIYFIFMLIDRIVSNNKKAVSIKPLIVSDTIIIVLIFGVLFAWDFGVVEKRNAAINANATSSQLSDSTAVIQTEEEYETLQETVI